MATPTGEGPGGSIWFLCKGCGGIAGYFPNEYLGLPAGSISHTKPAEHVNLVPVQCRLYQETESAQYWEMHRDATRAEAPLRMQRTEAPAMPESEATAIPFSIVRGLDSFDGDEQIAICAFLDKMEAERSRGEDAMVLGWSIYRTRDFCHVEVLYRDLQARRARAPTFVQAVRKLGNVIIDDAMRGAAQG